jgi:hypothetical protein
MPRDPITSPNSYRDISASSEALPRDRMCCEYNPTASSCRSRASTSDAGTRMPPIIGLPRSRRCVAQSHCSYTIVQYPSLKAASVPESPAAGTSLIRSQTPRKYFHLLTQTVSTTYSRTARRLPRIFPTTSAKLQAERTLSVPQRHT